MNIKAYTFSRVTPKETRGAPGRTTSLEKDTGVSKKWHPRPKRKIFQGGGGWYLWSRNPDWKFNNFKRSFAKSIFFQKSNL